MQYNGYDCGSYVAAKPVRQISAELESPLGGVQGYYSSIIR